MAEVHAVGATTSTNQSECDICGAHFADQDTLRRHRQKPHPIACKVQYLGSQAALFTNYSETPFHWYGTIPTVTVAPTGVQKFHFIDCKSDNGTVLIDKSHLLACKVSENPILLVSVHSKTLSNFSSSVPYQNGTVPYPPVFRIRIQVDPDSNHQSGSGFGIRILQLKLSFFKTVEGCTDRVGTVKSPNTVTFLT